MKQFTFSTQHKFTTTQTKQHGIHLVIDHSRGFFEQNGAYKILHKAEKVQTKQTKNEKPII